MLNTSLAERILDAFPSGDYGLVALLRLLDIVETTEIDTAAVECTALPRMLINPEFVARHADTSERLLMLVMHELHHVLLGHTRLCRRQTPADNFVFDAVINAVLCGLFPGVEYTSFFTRFYSDKRFPECFLRPPEVWDSMYRAAPPPALEGMALRIREVYSTLYSPWGATYQEVYDALSGLLPETIQVPLIGSHGEELPQSAGMAFEAVHSTTAFWRYGSGPNPFTGRSWSEDLDVSQVQPRRSSRARLRALLQKVAGPGAVVNRGARTVNSFPSFSPVPAADRRAVVLRALGVPQLLYRSETLAPRRPFSERVHVYLDVSASIPDPGALYGAVLDCREIVHSTVHLFSTAVHDITLEQLRRGEYRTTGGTEIECVAGHIARHGVRRAVLVTDGFVGTPGRSARTTLERTVIGVALTSRDDYREDLEPVARYWADLEEETKP